MSGLTVRILALLAVVALAAAIGWAFRRRDRRITAVTSGDVLTPADLHSFVTTTPADDAREPALGDIATFVQFSTPVCAGCRPAARVIDGLVEGRPGLRRIEIDATVRPDLAGRFDVLSTPTVLVLDRAGQVVSRFTGVPTAEQALAAAGLPALSR